MPSKRTLSDISDESDDEESLSHRKLPEDKNKDYWIKIDNQAYDKKMLSDWKLPKNKIDETSTFTKLNIDEEFENNITLRRNPQFYKDILSLMRTLHIPVTSNNLNLLLQLEIDRCNALNEILSTWCQDDKEKYDEKDYGQYINLKSFNLVLSQGNKLTPQEFGLRIGVIPYENKVSQEAAQKNNPELLTNAKAKFALAVLGLNKENPKLQAVLHQVDTNPQIREALALCYDFKKSRVEGYGLKVTDIFIKNIANIASQNDKDVTKINKEINKEVHKYLRNSGAYGSLFHSASDENKKDSRAYAFKDFKAKYLESARKNNNQQDKLDNLADEQFSKNPKP